MSHGGGDSTCPIIEPNLTPLLDVVLQLLMFFMMCVNFVTEQVNKDIKLPVSESAKAVDKADADALFLNQKSMKSKEFRNSLSPTTLERLGDAESVVMVPGK